jgi:hypothetical protein
MISNDYTIILCYNNTLLIIMFGNKLLTSSLMEEYCVKIKN